MDGKSKAYPGAGDAAGPTGNPAAHEPGTNGGAKLQCEIARDQRPIAPAPKRQSDGDYNANYASNDDVGRNGSKARGAVEKSQVNHREAGDQNGQPVDRGRNGREDALAQRTQWSKQLQRRD